MEPLVDVNIAVYNHAPFLRQTLDGVLNQITTFPFRLLIGDDCSTDGSIEILKEYEKKYPDKIKVIYQPKNLGIKSSERNGIVLLKNSTAKYIALLDGDDYWTSPHKLQTQVDVLEKDSTLSMAAHGSYKLIDDRLLPVDSPFKVDTIWSTKDILENKWFIMTASLMFRRSMMDFSPDWFFEVSHADLALVLLASLNGDGFYSPEPMCIYRIAGLGAMSRFAIKDSKNYISLLNHFNKRSNYKFDKEITTQKERIRVDIVHQYIAQNKSTALFSARYWQNVIQCLKWARIRNWPNLAKKLVRGKLSK